jgi:hypothetical protein
VAWFVIYLALSAAVLGGILAGAFAARRTPFAWVLLTAIMICDLCRADAPWIRCYNYKAKYTMNPVVDLLRQKPWEHRVVSRLSPQGPYDIGTDGNFGNLCHWWLENDYPFNDIQSLEIDQAPRMPDLDRSYLANFIFHSTNDLSPAAVEWLSVNPRNSPIWSWVAQSGPASRLWRLTNTRYLLANAYLTDVLNQFAGTPNGFRTLMRLSMVPKPGIAQPEDAGDWTLNPDSNGDLALIENIRALPRAKLFAHWQVVDDPTALQLLDSPRFDPEETVLVAATTPVAPAANLSGADAGTVEITHYESRNLVLQANAKTPAVLLLNDHFGDFWNVWIDRKPATVLRCNYIMRGVLVDPGPHTMEFRYHPPRKMLFLSLGTFAGGILLAGYVLAARLLARGPGA